jgi:hypothetical protein
MGFSQSALNSGSRNPQPSGSSSVPWKVSILLVAELRREKRTRLYDLNLWPQQRQEIRI